MKYDLVTRERLFKLVLWGAGLIHKGYKLPDFPGRNHYYAVIYDNKGNMFKEADCYFNANNDEMIEFCEKQNVPYPTKEGVHVPLWSVVYDVETHEVIMVKAYVRYIK